MVFLARGVTRTQTYIANSVYDQGCEARILLIARL